MTYYMRKFRLFGWGSVVHVPSQNRASVGCFGFFCISIGMKSKLCVVTVAVTWKHDHVWMYTSAVLLAP